MTDTSLTMTLDGDNSNDFRWERDYDLERALDRAGAITIKPDGDGQFQIFFIDVRFQDGDPGTINLNLSGLFDVVQACRTAWERALEDLMNTRPSPTGGEYAYRPYENAWDKPVDDGTFRKLAAKLAVAGDELFSSIFERNQGTTLDQIAANLREIARSGSRTLAVKTADFHIPWRMLYTHPTGKLDADGGNFVPSGFWGYQHVVEQFPARYRVSDHVRARGGKLGFAAALHELIDTEFSVDCIKRHRDFIQSSTDRLAYDEWTKVAELTNGLSANPFERQVIYFLCHAEAAGTTAAPSLTPPTLQLVDGKIDAVAVRKSIAKRFQPSPPLIFINACRGGQLGTLVRQSFTFASEFLGQGAVCVVGPQIEVPAVFAGEFGNRFFTAFMQRTKPPPQAGIVLRNLTQEMWKHNNPFGLVYSLYAGADCHIRWAEEVTT
jgi:hypothetical protein